MAVTRVVSPGPSEHRDVVRGAARCEEEGRWAATAPPALPFQMPSCAAVGAGLGRGGSGSSAVKFGGLSAYAGLQGGLPAACTGCLRLSAPKAWPRSLGARVVHLVDAPHTVLTDRRDRSDRLKPDTRRS